jgi:hypothetical protein
LEGDFTRQEDDGMDEFVAAVRLPNELTQRVAIQADDSGKVWAMLETQHGQKVSRHTMRGGDIA